jgi:hypothetical protein
MVIASKFFRRKLGLFAVIGCVSAIALAQFQEDGEPRVRGRATTTIADGDVKITHDDDPAVNAVLCFYRLLLADDPHTAGVDIDGLFLQESGLESLLKLRSKEDRPAAHLMVEWFREHKADYLPSHSEGRRIIVLSAPTAYVRFLDRRKGTQDLDLVFVHLVDKKENEFAKDRQVCFTVTRGRINPDCIFIDGNRGVLLSEKYK